IDDDNDFLELIKMYAAKFYKDFNIRSINDPREVISNISREDLSHFDVIISDYKMPHINGEDILRFLRSNSIRTPFVLCSSIDVTNSSISDHVEYFLKKRKSIKSLLNELQNFLKLLTSENFNFF
ncbi:MAG: response regulator, partial [Candidatus Kariarchaeaceae archaeon]